MATPFRFQPVQEDRQQRETTFQFLQAPEGTALDAAFKESFKLNPTTLIHDFFSQQEASVTGSKISPEEANRRFGIQNSLTFERPITEAEAQMRRERKQSEIANQDRIRRAQLGLTGNIKKLGVEFGAQVFDPLNIASAFIPVVGEARAASLVARFGKGGGRAITGLIEGAVGAALTEGIVAPLADELDYDYDFMDSLMNVTFGAAIGTGLHYGFGKIGDMIQSGRITPEAHQTSVRTAVAHLAMGQRVNVRPIVKLATAQELELRGIKSARASADVFSEGFTAQERGFFESRNLLSQKEQRLLSLTDTDDVIDAQAVIAKETQVIESHIKKLEQDVQERTNLTDEGKALNARDKRKIKTMKEEVEANKRLVRDVVEARKKAVIEADKVDTLPEPELRSMVPDEQVSRPQAGQSADIKSVAKKRISDDVIQSQLKDVMAQNAEASSADLRAINDLAIERIPEQASAQFTTENTYTANVEHSRAIQERVRSAPDNYSPAEAEQALNDIMEEAQELLDVDQLDSIREADTLIERAQAEEEAYVAAAGCVLTRGL